LLCPDCIGAVTTQRILTPDCLSLVKRLHRCELPDRAALFPCARNHLLEIRALLGSFIGFHLGISLEGRSAMLELLQGDL
jgi:hypothetical protein